jgi:hypothetical protein
VIDAAAALQYDARAFEVVRETKQTAWEALVIGERCTAPSDGSAGCVRVKLDASECGVPAGWSMYSVERFYAAPLVYDVACGLDAGTGRVALSFTSHNNFKMNGAHPGVAKLFGPGDSAATAPALATVNFTFVAHWRPTAVSIDVTDIVAEVGPDFSGMLAVENEWNDHTFKAFSCANSTATSRR